MDPDLCTINLISLAQNVDDASYSTVWGLPSWACWLIIAIFVLVSGVFSACENAFSNCNKYHFRALANKGNLTAKIIIKLVDKFDNTLVTILVGNNIVQTLMSFLSALLFFNLVKMYNLSDGIESILSTVVMASLVYIVSDTCPKILSKAIPNRLAYILAWPVYITGFILYPVVIIFRGVLTLVHKIMKIKDESLLSKEDLLHSVSEAINDEEDNASISSQEEKLFENDEKEIVENVFDFDTESVEKVYTSLDKVFALNIENLSIEELNKEIVKIDYSRIPVYEEEKNNIVGILVLKTYFEEYVKDPHLEVRSILEDVIYIEYNMKLDDAFSLLNAEKVHMGIVKKDGNIIGIVTMEDILEELVEDIDETPANKLKWRKAK